MRASRPPAMVFVHRRSCSEGTRVDARDDRPTPVQMRAHFVQSMVPMIGFGFMDNTVMIHAGHAIDLTLGVTFGLSTMAAAACGQICSDVAGVSFGGMIEAAARRLGLPSPGFTEKQIDRADVKRIQLLGAVLGVFVGCSLGLCNLLLIDSEKKERTLELQTDSVHGAEYTVSISNAEREDTTAIIVDGPAGKGLLASILNVLMEKDVAIYEISTTAADYGEFKSRRILVTQNGEQIPDEEIEDLAKAVLGAAKHPLRTKQLLRVQHNLQQERDELKHQLELAMSQLEKLQIRVSKRNSSPAEEADAVDAAKQEDFTP